VDAGDADEPQRGRQVRLQMVHMRHRPSGAEAHAAPGGEDDRVPLPIRQHGHVGIKRVALVQPDRAVQAHHLIDPRLERRRHAEVVERRADDQHIGGQQFVHQPVAFGQRVLHPRLPALFRGKGRGDPVMADEGGRVLADVPVSHAILRATLQPLTDEALAEVAAVRTVFVLASKAGAGAGIEVQKVRHGESPL